VLFIIISERIVKGIINKAAMNKKVYLVAAKVVIVVNFVTSF
jgi:hypothetical protein